MFLLNSNSSPLTLSSVPWDGSGNGGGGSGDWVVLERIWVTPVFAFPAQLSLFMIFLACGGSLLSILLLQKTTLLHEVEMHWLL